MPLKLPLFAKCVISAALKFKDPDEAITEQERHLQILRMRNIPESHAYPEIHDGKP
jgi:hypothetical protein